MLEAENVVWQRRWEALDHLMKVMQGDIAQELNVRTGNAAPSPRQREAIDRLQNLLACLKSFAGKQFHYFYNGFYYGAPALELSPEYPPDYVMMATLDQIGYDLRVIAHALSQRFSQTDGINETLDKADVLGQEALRPAAAAFGLEKTRAITYLQKSPSIRVIPYANVALVGVPYTAVSVPRDFLAIPHEVGHFVYWHGRRGEQSLAYQLMNAAPKKPAWAYRWLEELFADLYGCYVAGPIQGLSFQDLQLQLSQEEFITDDQDHPAPILRPNVYTKGLELAGFPQWAQALDTRWNGNPQAQRGAAGGKRSKRYDMQYAFRMGNGQFRMVRDAISLQPGLDDARPVDRLIRLIAGTLQSMQTDNWWREDVGDAANLAAAYDDFDAKIKAFDPNEKRAKETAVACIEHDVLLARWLKEGKAMRDSIAAPEEKPPEWLPALQADGWATEGPTSNPPPPTGG